MPLVESALHLLPLVVTGLLGERLQILHQVARVIAARGEVATHAHVVPAGRDCEEDCDNYSLNGWS